MDSDYEIVTEISKMATTIAAKDTEKVALVIDVWKGGGREGRATNEDLTFSAAGGDGIGPRLPVRVRPRVRVPVGLSHVKTSGRAGGGERDHETNKFLANCHRRKREGGRGREGGGTTVWE